MAAYLQMGHDSENLVGASGLESFAGVVLSPVNRDETALAKHVQAFRKLAIDVLFDPQLYFPRSERGALPRHRYFPADLETADLGSIQWWISVVQKLARSGAELGVHGICSPVTMPSRWTDDYFRSSAEVYEVLKNELAGTATRPLMTVCLNLKQLSTPADALRIASILTSVAPTEIYLVIEAETDPRRELAEAVNLFAVMVFVNAMEHAGCRVLVSHCSSELLLMKAAGASSCATGKFFNLRRFSKSRFEEEKDGGGGQLPYWFEHSLLAYLRRADIARLQRDGFEGLVTFEIGPEQNPFAKQILEQFINDPGQPWLGLAWRQFLWWFSAAERQLASPDRLKTAGTWLRIAEENWQRLEDADVLLEEPRNNGSWLRSWRQSLADFKRFAQ